MSATKQKGLGRGLSALMGEEADAPATRAHTAPTNNRAGNLIELPITALKPGKYQPRSNFRLEQLQELADSIAHNGIMQPILARPLDNEGNYEIVAGERRWRAAKLADLQTIPVIVRELPDKLALELAIVENIQRADLSPVEEAAGYQRLIDEFDYTQEELAETVGKSRSHIANLLRLLNLPDELKDMLDTGELSMGHARALLGNKDAIKLAEEVVRKGLNVRQTEALSRRDPNKPLGRPRKGIAPQSAMPGTSHGAKDPDIIALEETLSENLGLKVSIDDQGSNGLISIQYTTLEQLDDILRRLGGSI
jgi:ParB family transcriptional regulator, chromosome partitioning protein